MTEHHPDAIESNIETHPVKLAAMIGVGSISLVVLIIMLAYFAVGTYGVGVTAAEKAALKDEAIARRLTPVGYVESDPAKAVAPVVAAPAPPQVAAAPAAKLDGKAAYESGCNACHGAGVAGAPKLGDKAAWADRIKQGVATLHDHALKGFQGKAGVMPAKGGIASLGDDAVKAAVDYMVGQAK